MNMHAVFTTESTPLELASFTVDQYHRMLETGILADAEPVELLDGLLVIKDRGPAMTLSPQHRFVVSLRQFGSKSFQEAGFPAISVPTLEFPANCAPKIAFGERDWP